MKLRSFVFFALKLSLSAVLIWFIFKRIDVTGVTTRLREVHRGLLLAALPLALLLLALSASRWRLFAGGLMSRGAAFRYTWIGLFYGALLPGGVSGDVAKGAALALKDRSTRVSDLPGSILMDRLVGFATLILLFTASVLWCIQSATFTGALLTGARWGAFGGLAGCAGFAFLLLPVFQRLALALVRRWPASLGGKLLLQLAVSLIGYTRDSRRLAQAFALSLGVHVVNVGLFLLFFASLDQKVGIFPAVVMYSVISVLVMIPISISAVGVRDWFALLYFQHLHLAPEAGVAFSWLCLLFSLTVAAGGGLVQVYEIFLRSPTPSPSA